MGLGSRFCLRRQPHGLLGWLQAASLVSGWPSWCVYSGTCATTVTKTYSEQSALLVAPKGGAVGMRGKCSAARASARRSYGHDTLNEQFDRVLVHLLDYYQGLQRLTPEWY